MSDPAVNNTIALEETETGRTLRVQLTDRAVESLADPLSLFMTGQVRRRGALLQRESPTGNGHAPALSPAQVTAADETIPQTVAARPATPATTSGTDLHDIVHIEGDVVRLDRSRLRATSKKDYTMRAVYLLLLAQKELLQRERVPRKDILDALHAANVYDGNTGTYVNQDAGLDTADDSLRMKAEARDAVRRILAELTGPELDNEWWPGKDAPIRRGKGTDGDDEAKRDDGASTQRRRTAGTASPVGPEVERWCATWRNLPLGAEVNGHDVLKDKPSLDRALFTCGPSARRPATARILSCARRSSRES
jgi:hypothetical protein